MVKICGLRSCEHVATAVEAGTDFVGFVMTESKRRVSPVEARELVRVARSVRADVRTVGVFTSEAVIELNQTTGYCGFDFIQVGGDHTVERLRHLCCPAIRVLHVAPSTDTRWLIEDMERADSELQANRPVHLLDTYRVGVGGGTGESFDWTVAAEISRRHPVFVAGGLTPENVRELVLTARPYGVDVSSGVEQNGAKQSELIRAFIDSVRKAEQEIHDD
ncbi:MAG: phosphoribosylanthranilate isomerase [Chloroflexota bacterium]